MQLQRQGEMDPKNNEGDKLEYLKKISWQNCVIKIDQRRQLEEFLVEYHNVFAKHRFDVGYNTEFRVKLTLEHPLLVYV